jgi:AAA15 family ATPase/GTPase
MAFITSLRIKNFFSIKDEVTIDFKASPYNIENNPERLFEFNGEYYNKVISFYGANASGKTTVLKAITLLANVISNQNSENDLISFKNKFSPITNSTEIQIDFVLFINESYKKFIYQIEFESNGYENNGIKNEQLYEVRNNEKIIWLDRRDSHVLGLDNNILEGVFNNLDKNKSLIEEFYKFEKTKTFEEIYRLFAILTQITNVNIYQSEFNTTYQDKKTIATLLDTTEQYSGELEAFFLSFFQSIGLDIVKIRVNFKEEDGKPKEFIGIEIFHAINEKEFLELDLESDGTQMLMKILMNIFSAKVMDTPLVVDEFDSILHPILIPVINNLLIQNDIQIIYSTHNIYNMQFLQNDEIFLIEKDSNHKTTIKAVKDNPDIKGYKNLLTLYENGYLGGLPNVKEILTKIL